LIIKEARLKQIIREEVGLRILTEIIEEELDKFLLENKDLEAYKNRRRKSLIDAVKNKLIPLAVVGSLLGVLADKSSDYSDIKAAERAAAAAQADVQAELSGHALDQVEGLLGSSANFMWSIDPGADQGTVGGEGDQDFQDRVSQMQNFPIFQDYMGGATQMFSQEYGVLLKLQQDIKNQIAKGVTNKADLKPGISLDSVQSPDISKEQYAKEYKNLYNIPDFNPAKVGKADIGGNIEQVQKASKGGIKFLQGKGKSYGYETYELLDTVNPELPNAGMSPSQYYIQMFNKVTGQSIGK
jgi:hypothetical protein